MSYSRKKYLLKNTIIFAISAIANKFIAFFLVPIYTNALSPEEFGKVDLLFTICSFLFPLFTLNITESIYRFSMDKDKNDKKIFDIGIVCFILSILLSLITIPIFNLFEEYKEYSVYFYFYLITVSLSQMLLSVLKGQERLKLFSFGNILNAALIGILNILLLVVFQWGTKGYFIAYIVANAITIVFCALINFRMFSIKKFKFDKKLFKNMTKYSIVLLPTSFMWWIINSSDRVMVTSLISSEANGIYAISYKIPSLLTTVASIFNQAWIFSAIKEKDSNDYQLYFNKIFKLLFNALCLISCIILLVLKPAYKIFINAEYFDGWRYVPFLIVGYIFMTLATFVSSIYNVYKDNKGFLISGLLGAITNIVLNFILIPLIGVYGAALATAISYFTVYVYRLINVKKYITIKMNVNYIFSIIVVLLIAISIYFEGYFSIVVGIALLILYLIINRKNIVEFGKMMTSKLKKKSK